MESTKKVLKSHENTIKSLNCYTLSTILFRVF